MSRFCDSLRVLCKSDHQFPEDCRIINTHENQEGEPRTGTSVTCPICGAGPGEKRELSSRQPEQSRTVTEAWLQKTIPKNNALGKVNSQLFFIL
jgi:hypothetical protein